MNELKVKKGDTGEAVYVTLLRNGVVVDLTDSEVKYYISNGIEGIASIDNVISGQVYFPLE